MSEHQLTVEPDAAGRGGGPVEIDADQRVVLIRIPRSYSDVDDPALYDATRGWWRIGANRRKLGSASAPDYALSVYRGTVQGAYRIEGWEPAPPEEVAVDPKREGRWRFTGRRDADLEARYLGGDVTALFPIGSQTPLRFVGCGPTTTAAKAAPRPLTSTGRRVGLPKEFVPVPSADEATLDDLWQFALTYNGYEHHGGVQGATDLADATVQRWRQDGALPDDVDEARGALFYEDRRRRQGNAPLGKDDERYIRALVGRIAKLSDGTVPVRRLGK